MILFDLNYKILCEDFIDSSLLLFEKPIIKLLNKRITLYHGTSSDITDGKLTPMSINVGATKFSNPRWSTFFWDNLDLAIEWTLYKTLGEKKSPFKTFYGFQDNRTLICSREGSIITENNIMKYITANKIHGFIYTVNVPSSIVEIGSSKLVNEYTISKEVDITEKRKIYITRSLFRKYFEIVSREEFIKRSNDFCSNIEKGKLVRKSNILNNILNDYRDFYRKEVKDEIKLGNINIGDDIRHFKKNINDGVRYDKYNIKNVE